MKISRGFVDSSGGVMTGASRDTADTADPSHLVTTLRNLGRELQQPYLIIFIPYNGQTVCLNIALKDELLNIMQSMYSNPGVMGRFLMLQCSSGVTDRYLAKAIISDKSK